MADLLSRDNLYYTCSQYNSTSSNQIATTDDTLLAPILQNSSDYQVAISKARIDLSGVPLTTHNIPLKTYQVGLQSGDSIYTAYVRQVNAENKNYLFNIAPAGTYSKLLYLNNGSATELPLPVPIPIYDYFQTIFNFVETDYENTFVVGSASPNASTYNLLIAFDKSGNVVYQNTFASIQGIALDRQSNLYIAVEDGTGSAVLVYQLNELVNPIEVTLVQTITQDFNGDNLVSIKTICAEGELIVGSETNKISIYDTLTWTPVTTYLEGDISNLGNYSSILSAYDRFILTDLGTTQDFQFGIENSSDILQLMQSGGTFVGGTWQETARVALWSAGTQLTYGFGANSNFETIAFTYQNGIVGSPFLVNTSTLIGNCFNGYQFGSIAGLAFGNTGALIQWNLDQLPSPSNTWSFCDRTFFPAINENPLSCDTQQSTGKILAVGRDNALYLTNEKIFPKICYYFKDFIQGSNAGVTIFQQGIGLNQPNTSTALVEIQNETNILTNSVNYITADSFVKVAGTGYLLFTASPVVGGSSSVQIQEFSTYPFFTPVGSSVTLSALNANNSHRMSAFNNILSISGGTNVYNYDTSFNLVSTIPLASSPVNGKVLTSSVNWAGTIILAIVYDSNVEYYNMTIPASPTLLLSLVFNPGTGVSFISGVGWIENAGNYYLAMTTDENNAGDALVNNLWCLRVLPNYAFDYVFPASDTTRTYWSEGDNTIYINPNINGQEIICFSGASGDSISAGTMLLMYNSGNGNNVQIVAEAPIGVTNPNIYYFPDEISYSFGWTQITQVGGSISCISACFSQTNQNDVYALDVGGTAYYGNLAGTQIQFFPFAPITATNWRSINTLPNPPSVFDTYVKQYSISTQTQTGDDYYGAVNVTGLARNPISGEFLVAHGGTLSSYTPETLALNWSNSTITGLNLIYAKNGEDINAGDVNIYDFQTLIDAINVAFLEAYQKVPSGVFSQAPNISVNFQTCLATMNYSGDYVGGSVGILFNSNLHQLLYFYSVQSQVNTAFYKNILPATSTSLTQSGNSLYLFNQLDKIIFTSQTIFVFGSYLLKNSTNQIISDFDVPTNEVAYGLNNLSSVLYVQPAFLRPFIMNSQIPISRIQLQLFYTTLQGEQFPLELVPQANFNCKLIFCRRY